MKFPINLASQPFRRDRAMFVASIAVSLLLVFTLGALLSIARADNAQLGDLKKDVAQLEQQTRRMAAEQAKLDSVLHRPESVQVLEESAFLNTILLRKGISWTKIFADLEEVTPYNVKVIQIHPSVNAQDHVSLDMLVGAGEVGPVIQMFKSLQGSPKFSDADVKILQSPTQSEPIFKCRLSVDYAQKL